VRGICAIVLGAFAFARPEATFAALVYFIGAYAVITGTLAILYATCAWENTTHHWAVIAEGLVGILAGVIAFSWPGITAIALVWLVASWALVIGGLEIAAAFTLRSEIRGEFWLGVCGLLSLAFGVLAFLYPGAGALGILGWFGAYAIASGIVRIALGVQLYQQREDLQTWREPGNHERAA
jgi:uncharacterized membrane protein HdeD (DUF308 family)